MIASITNARCDHPACPALSQHQTLVHGQDFYFCNHHAAELAEILVKLPTEARRPAAQFDTATTTPTRTRATDGPPARRT